MEKPEGLVKYRRAMFTQAIYKISPPFPGAKTVRKTTADGGMIDREPRTLNEAKYQVPGGMVGIRGWKSDLYKFVPEPPKTVVAFISVKQGAPLGGYQSEYGFRRAYPDGTYFMDVLSYEGKVFEARVREKNEGKWESYVAYKDYSARPPGYHGLKQTCNSCHFDTGTGDYGSALVAGGDTVISDPFPELER